jgi:hypothetical protein
MRISRALRLRRAGGERARSAQGAKVDRASVALETLAYIMPLPSGVVVSRTDESDLVGDDDQLRPVTCTELRHCVTDVGAYRGG